MMGWMVKVEVYVFEKGVVDLLVGVVEGGVVLWGDWKMCWRIPGSVVRVGQWKHWDRYERWRRLKNLWESVGG